MGELAAFITAIFWTFTSIFFSSASQQLGSVKVNRLRLVFAVVFLMIAHVILRGGPVPVDGSAMRWLWMGLSGIVGLVFGDACLLQAYVMVGTRLGTLMMATAPVISTLLAWVFLGERLNAGEILGIGITVLGIMVVVLERGGRKSHITPRQYALGLLCGLGGALGQAGGLILAKLGLEGGYPSISGVVMRMTVAAATMWLLALAGRQVRPTLQTAWNNKPALRFIFFGAFFGPFLGVWLSLVSVQATYVGIASTLMALTPILILPVLRIWFQEHITWRAVLGTVVALAGVAVLLLQG